MKNVTVPLSAAIYLTFLVLNSGSALADPLKSFGPFSTKNTNVQNEIRRSTGTTLEGSGKLWSHLTGLGVRTGVRFKDPVTLKHLVESLHASGIGSLWDGYTGGNEIRVYFDNDKDNKSTSDLIWYFYRNHKTYCVPELYLWTAGLYQPQKMYLVRPASRRYFEALVRSIARHAKRRKARFQLINFGGD